MDISSDISMPVDGGSLADTVGPNCASTQEVVSSLAELGNMMDNMLNAVAELGVQVAQMKGGYDG